MSSVNDISMIHSETLHVQEGTIGAQAYASTYCDRHKTPRCSSCHSSAPSKREANVLRPRSKNVYTQYMTMPKPSYSMAGNTVTWLTSNFLGYTGRSRQLSHTPYMTAEKFPAPSVPLDFHATALLPRAVVFGLNPQALLHTLASLASFRA